MIKRKVSRREAFGRAGLFFGATVVGAKLVGYCDVGFRREFAIGQPAILVLLEHGDTARP